VNPNTIPSVQRLGQHKKELSIRFAVSRLFLNSRPRDECVIRVTPVRDESHRPLQANELEDIAVGRMLG
jgi:hypothetical protein